MLQYPPYKHILFLFSLVFILFYILFILDFKFVRSTIRCPYHYLCPFALASVGDFVLDPVFSCIHSTSPPALCVFLLFAMTIYN